MVDARGEFERSWASVERKPDVEQREGNFHDQESLQRQVDVLNKKLEIYRSREASICNNLNTIRDEDEKKKKALQDLKQNNQILVKKVLKQEKEIGLMRGRLKENREKSINLSKEFFSLKQQKGFDDKSQKLREENCALRKELIQIRDEHVHKINPNRDGEGSGKVKPPRNLVGEKVGEKAGGMNGKSERMGMEGLKWQLWASQESDGEEVKGAKVKWTQASSAFGGTDFVNFQNEVEDVCQELQQKTSLIQKLRKDLRRRESEFSNSFSKSMVEANESLAKVKEETAETIATLQEQLKKKENVEKNNSELQSQIESLQSNQKSICNRYDVEKAVKNGQIHALEKTIQTQEQVIENIKEEMQELRNQKEKLSIDKTEEARDLKLQANALKARAEAFEKTVSELNATVERQKIDYLAQVQSLQLIIEEMEREGPLSRAIETLEKTEMMTEVRLRVGDLKAMNQRLREENLKLGFKIDAASLKLKKMDALEEESKEIKVEFARMKENLDLFQSPKFDDVQNENLMLREKLKFIATELRQDERNCLIEEANEWRKQSSDASATIPSSFSNLSDYCDKFAPEDGPPVRIDEASTAQGAGMIDDATIEDLSKLSIDNGKWL
ncbi:unnamed protein product [Cylindrotheca closterium]|uniref:Uncharacterized protein n=1 Tax=Cylindrotheca closterium TaxID=2856 RepID=A0AAD2CVC0_9STRA|nr:unnamed protein product [Cylindrotheca closterium]